MTHRRQCCQSLDQRCIDQCWRRGRGEVNGGQGCRDKEEGDVRGLELSNIEELATGRINENGNCNLLAIWQD